MNSFPPNKTLNNMCYYSIPENPFQKYLIKKNIQFLLWKAPLNLLSLCVNASYNASSRPRPKNAYLYQLGST